jgi:hypothetical protein
MAKASPEVYFGAVKELVERRGQVVGSARCHAKVCTLTYEDLFLTFEGSANLRTCRNVENLAVINDRGLCEWRSSWIDEKVQEHALDKS